MKRLSFIILGLAVGILATLFVQSREIFNPFDFRIIEHENFQIFLQQKIVLPLPMTEHLTEVWIRDKRLPESSSPWKYIGSVHTEPFDLSEVQFDIAPNLNLRFPWGASLATEDHTHWESKYNNY